MDMMEIYVKTMLEPRAPPCGRRGWLLRTIVVQVVFSLHLCIWDPVWTRYIQLLLLGVGMRRVAQFGVGLYTCSMSYSLAQLTLCRCLRSGLHVPSLYIVAGFEYIIKDL